jgi:1-acyl-sn-glycerol-3-phosphate acyltransferase
MKKQKVVFYKELTEDFVGNDIKPISIDGSYIYEPNNIFWKMCAWFLYRVIALPIGFLYSKLKFRYKIINSNALKPYKNQGYFIYINHTQTFADVTWPTLITFPKKAFIVASPNNVSLPILGDITKMIGAIPIPSDFKSGKNFVRTISNKIKNKNVIAIYPEAHVWDYYTGIRPFGVATFKYPVETNAPVFSITITYQKDGKRKTPRIVAYVDGPFAVDKENASLAEKKKMLRDMVYEKMLERSKNSNFEVIKYIKTEDK